MLACKQLACRGMQTSYDDTLTSAATLCKQCSGVLLGFTPDTDHNRLMERYLKPANLARHRPLHTGLCSRRSTCDGMALFHSLLPPPPLIPWCKTFRSVIPEQCATIIGVRRYNYIYCQLADCSPAFVSFRNTAYSEHSTHHERSCLPSLQQGRCCSFFCRECYYRGKSHHIKVLGLTMAIRVNVALEIDLLRPGRIDNCHWFLTTKISTQ